MRAHGSAPPDLSCATRLAGHASHLMLYMLRGTPYDARETIHGQGRMFVAAPLTSTRDFLRCR
jgi:hypothetical protein